MKKIIGLLLLSMIILVNCGKDDENEALYAVWIGTNISVIDCDSQNNNSSTRLGCENTNCYRLELKSDGTYSYQQGSGAVEGNWSVSGGMIFLCQDDDGTQICDEYINDELNSTTLKLATINTNNNCRRVITFQREEILDELNNGV